MTEKKVPIKVLAELYYTTFAFNKRSFNSALCVAEIGPCQSVLIKIIIPVVMTIGLLFVKSLIHDRTWRLNRFLLTALRIFFFDTTTPILGPALKFRTITREKFWERKERPCFKTSSKRTLVSLCERENTTYLYCQSAAALSPTALDSITAKTGLTAN